METGGNGKPPQWKWELPARPYEFIPTCFMVRYGNISLLGGPPVITGGTP